MKYFIIFLVYIAIICFMLITYFAVRFMNSDNDIWVERSFVVYCVIATIAITTNIISSIKNKD